jgi:tRNA G10  N-methylase Trm11
MAYRLTERADHSDVASGFVLRSVPGHPAFPVRLAQELFLRAVTHLPEGPLTLWDPCCGSGYLATVLGLLHRPRLGRVVASDIAPEAVSIAKGNVSLLTSAGLAARAAELRVRQRDFDKPSYGEAAEAAGRLAATLAASGGDLAATATVADVFDPASLAAALATAAPDVVVTDLPYGTQTAWAGPHVPSTDPIHGMLRGLAAVLPEHAVLAVATRARRFPPPPGVRPLERLRVGTRVAFIGRAGELRAAAAP